MLVHEIVAIRKGGVEKDVVRQVVELQSSNDDRRQDPAALRIQSTVHLEGSREALEGVFGAEFQVGQKFELAEVQFTPMEG